MSLPNSIESIYDIVRPKKGQRITLPKPYGSADSLIIANWIKKKNNSNIEKKGVKRLIICNSQETADRIHEEVNYLIPNKNVKLFSDWETLPYEPFSPHKDLISDRLLCLYETALAITDAIVINAETSLFRIVPQDFIASKTFFFHSGQTLPLNKLRTQLDIAGYDKTNQVISPGEFSIRGNIIDLFPMGSNLPFRIELFDEEIETIRLFDPDSQRSIHMVKEIRILPSKEFENTKENADNFRSNWRKIFEGDPTKCSLYKDAGNTLFGAGIEYYLPLLHSKLSSIFSYLSKNAEIVLIGNVSESIENHFNNIKQRYEFLKHDIERPVLKPEMIALSPSDWFSELNSFPQFSFVEKSSKEPSEALPKISINRKSSNPYQLLKNTVEKSKSKQIIVIITENLGRAETLYSNLKDNEIKSQLVSSWSEIEKLINNFPNIAHSVIYITAGNIHKGFVSKWLNLVLITESDLFEEFYRSRKKQNPKDETNFENLIKDLSELKLGSAVVHIDHGVGRYRGLTHLNFGDGETEFLKLEYANEANLYVPVAQLHLINRYCGADSEFAPLHKLGSELWDKTKKKALKKARDSAAELLDIYARRATKVGFSFEFNAKDFKEFSEEFPYVETPDQNSAIQSVVQDMISTKPMDRLVCGDVGFGKTEVALRAAFLAASSGKQVAVLTPTTLLAEQHFQTFCDRFSKYAISIRELSRFKLLKEIKTTISDLSNGKIDIVIGTHKLISSDVKFKNLGLIIIDEEHRFGVRQKEKFKELRSEVDTLTLTATPIPRTLAMSMEGIRDFSVIATAPQKRLAIKTLVRYESDITVQEALYRELRRGGQAYVLHNEVKTIKNRFDMLTKLIPEARIAIAHGQLPERELERVMRQFNQKQFNILLCTTIIETGIDIPSANTIIIYRADKFGLAQLHQLRGRVGRSHHQAYAYLLTPEKNSLSKNAVKRLEAIQSMEELGSGFFLALHDLEIRGAGEVLGEQQSGNISEIGFSLYTEMLETAIKTMKENTNIEIIDIPLSSPIDVNLHIPALLPKNYCPDVNERLTIYKRLADTKNSSELILIEDELIDRFGVIPAETKALFKTHEFRQKALNYGIKKIDMTNESITINFNDQPNIDISNMLELIKSNNQFKLLGPNKVKYEIKSKNLSDYSSNMDRFITLITLKTTKE